MIKIYKVAEVIPAKSPIWDAGMSGHINLEDGSTGGRAWAVEQGATVTYPVDARGSSP